MSVTLSQLRQVIREELLLDATERVEAEAEAEIVATDQAESEIPNILAQVASRENLENLVRRGEVDIKTSNGTFTIATRGVGGLGLSDLRALAASDAAASTMLARAGNLNVTYRTPMWGGQLTANIGGNVVTKDPASIRGSVRFTKSI